MARQIRHDYEGGWYHVMSRGFQRQAIFTNETENGYFVRLLADMIERYGVILHAYVLMPNHYHLLLETPHANASRALQWLNVSYSVWYNRRNARSGAVFQARYKSVLVEGVGKWALACSAYVHLNPVRVRALGLDKTSRSQLKAGNIPEPTPAQRNAWLRCLREHTWSSYPAYAGCVNAPKWLTCETLLDRVEPMGSVTAYEQFITQQLGISSDDYSSFIRSPVFGSEAFKEKIRRLLVKSNPKGETNLESWKRLLPFKTVVARMEFFKGEKWEVFAKRRGDWGRDMVLYNGRMQCGLTLGEIGEFVGMHPSAIAQSTARFVAKLTSQSSLALQQKEFFKILMEE